MPLFTYKCLICNYTEEYLDKTGEFVQHTCPVCVVECKNYVKFDLVTGEITRSGSVDGKDIATGMIRKADSKGKAVAMQKMLSRPTIIQKGYMPGDARYMRGSGGIKGK